MAIIRNLLDSRIRDFSDIQSFKEYDDKYTGKTGYFSDSLCRFQDLKCCYKFTLININNDEEAGDFIFESKGGNYRYFLPEKLLKPIEKKYRPYTLAEWINQHEIGDVIHYRSKSGEVELRQMYVGTRHSQGIKKIILKITLGNVSHTLDDLFEDYEIEVDGEWQPFGVLVKEEE